MTFSTFGLSGLRAAWLAALGVCLISIPLSTAFGSLSLAWGDVLRALAALASSQAPEQGCLALGPDGRVLPLSGQTMTHIVTDLRLPRSILAFCAGTGLALAGTVFQGILRNPLADPFTLGVSSGAAFGAALAITCGLGGHAFGLGIPLAGLAGAAGALALVLLLGGIGGGLRRETLVLAGVVVSAFLGALIALLKALDEASVGGIVFWIMGSFQGRGWPELWLALPGLILGGVLSLLAARQIDILGLGDRAASSLGLGAARTRLLLLGAASVMTASCVAVTGIIGFVGLIVPHLCRILLGPANRLVLPASALGGGFLLLWADVLSRMILPMGAELPVGVLTALLGGPFFCLILVRGNRPGPGWQATPESTGPVVPAGEPPARKSRASSPPHGACGLSAEDLSYRFPGGKGFTLHTINLTLRPGQRTALIGPNGSGKSTLISCLAGILVPAGGRAALAGRAMDSLPPRQRARQVAVLFQGNRDLPAFKASEMVLLGRYAHTVPLAGYAEEDRRIAAACLAATGTQAFAGRPLTALSGGELQRVLLARALAQQTPFLLLDEPTTGLDPAYQLALLDILKGLADRRGIGVLAAMHDLNLAALYFDRLLVLDQGRLIADGPAEEVLTAEILERVFGLRPLLLPHPDNGRVQVLPRPAESRQDTGLEGRQE